MRTTTRFCVTCGIEAAVHVDSDQAWGEYRCKACPSSGATATKRAARHHQPGRLELACQQETSRRRQRREHLADMWNCPA
jgi:DNA-directed RNA polymerase subunit RPC12/RpoP